MIEHVVFEGADRAGEEASINQQDGVGHHDEEDIRAGKEHWVNKRKWRQKETHPNAFTDESTNQTNNSSDEDGRCLLAEDDTSD